MSSRQHDFDVGLDEYQPEKDYLLDSYEGDEFTDGDRPDTECVEDWVRSMSDDEEEEREGGNNENASSDSDDRNLEPEDSETITGQSSSAACFAWDVESLESINHAILETDSRSLGIHSKSLDADQSEVSGPTDNRFADLDSEMSISHDNGVDGNDTHLLAMSDEMVGNQSTVQDETQSAFSDTSSDSDDWDMDAEIEKGKAGTADMVARISIRVDTTENSTDGSDNDAPQSADGRRTEAVQVTPVVESLEPSPGAKDLKIDEKKPWLFDGELDGALLPIGGDGGDDLYRRDVKHYLTGHRNFSWYTSDDPHTYGKPSLLSDSGTFTRLKTQLNQERWQRYQIANNFEAVKGELEVDREQIGTLKHAVDMRNRELENGRANAQRLEKISNQWKTAFEHQRPLADAERERQALMEAGHEFSQEYVDPLQPFSGHQIANRMCSADTQTSPIETYSQESTEKIPSTVAGMQTDNEDIAAEDHANLARERDELLAENNTLSDQVRKLAKLLEANKEWIEARNWEVKGSTKETVRNTDNSPGPEMGVQRAQSYMPFPDSASARDGLVLPLDSVMLEWPEHWTEREREIRRSASWVRARNIAAAELNSWTKQIWAGAGSRLALCG